MPHEISGDGWPEIRIAVLGKSKTDTLQETVNFLYDFNVAYEMSRLASDERHSHFSFSPFVWMRNGRPLDRSERLRVVKLKETSPLELVTAIAIISVTALPSIWLLVQIVEKAYNLPLNRRKLRAEIEKAERENRVAKQKEEQDLEQRARAILEDSQASPYLENVTRRLSKSTVVISEISVDYKERKERAD